MKRSTRLLERRARITRSLRILPGLVGIAVACASVSDARASWPPAPGADLKDSSSWPSDPEYASDWSYFSFLPTQATGTAPYIAADTTLGASGMRLDEAWESTTGSSSVTIAILDTGIEWDEPDLVNKAWLNVGELASHLPHRADGSACGPTTGAIAGFDCNGDGVVSVADYAADPALTPLVSGDDCTDPSTGKRSPRTQGDVNHNCILDAGDLIELFSDGVDDDLNGYADDIAGWDFYDDDNDPYDDVRGGHGTLQARYSSAEGNNALEGIGACPACRFVMLRAGSSVVVSSNDVAKGIVYATDNGASVVQEALAAVNLTAFARASIDYAYGKKVTIVASLGDDDSRHHELPATYNHTIAVHGIGFDGSSDTTSTSFLAYGNCTNYGGQLALSVSSASCSDEATGTAAGIVGLLYSYGLAQKPAIALTAEEAMQLEKMTADVVDVPQSRAAATASSYYESLPGFSQRFGYGRPNVPRALAAIESGLIPPEVEILTPAWFQTLYSNRVIGPVPIVGRVVATRATSYDVTVEWAPGVEPLEADFQTLSSTVTNVPGPTVMGGASMPLAVLDPSSLSTTHPADPDSPQHENDRTITVRVQATAHYPAGDVKGEARRSIALVNPMNGLDAELLPGFPLAFGGSIEGGPKLADVNGDGVRDVVLATNDGAVHVFSVTAGGPAEVSGFPYRLKPLDGLDPSSPVASLPSYVTAPAYAAGASGGIDPTVTRESVDGSVAIGDLFGNKGTEIVVASWEGTIYVIDSDGDDVTGWPQRLPQVPSCPQDPSVPRPPGDCMDVTHDITRGALASPVLVDLDGDGALEIVLAAFDGNVYAFNADGTMHAGFPVRAHSPLAYAYEHIVTTPAVADFNGDGVPDILVGSNETIGAEGSVGFFYVIDGRGTAAPGSPFVKNWPVEIASAYALPLLGQGAGASPVVVDIDGDGVPDALLQGTGQSPMVLPGDPGAQSGVTPPAAELPKRSGESAGFDAPNAFGPGSTALSGDTFRALYGSPSVGDLDQDGTPDVVMSGSDAFLAETLTSHEPKRFDHLLAMWSGKTGHMMTGSPVVVEDYSFLTSQAIADVTGDDYPEVIMGTGGYFVHAIDACGREAEGWPKFTGGWTTSTPAVGDVTGDGSLEVVTATREGYLYAWTTKGTSKGVVQWESFHHDNANTGSYLTALAQGKLALAASRIDCSALADAGAADGAVDGGTVTSSGSGCGCSLEARPVGSAAWLGLGVVGFAVARRRRRSL